MKIMQIKVQEKENSSPLLQTLRSASIFSSESDANSIVWNYCFYISTYWHI